MGQKHRSRRGAPPVPPETWLHVHGQPQWHDDVVIEGTRDGLTALRNAIDEALRSNREGVSVHLFTGDGEGYRAVARVRTSEQIRSGTLPYTDEIARDLVDRTP